jgi:hypothetical protein
MEKIMINYMQRLEALDLGQLGDAIADQIEVDFKQFWNLELLQNLVEEKVCKHLEGGKDADQVKALILKVLMLNDIKIPVDFFDAGHPINLPDFKGGSWATEWVLSRSPEQVRKFRFWRRPDPDPRPHNHPWHNPATGVSFVSQILSGGYTEDVYSLDGTMTTQVYWAGNVNVCYYDKFHVVRGILPGTTTYFETEAVTEEGWHYFVPGQGTFPPVPMDDFLEQRAAVNPR